MCSTGLKKTLRRHADEAYAFAMDVTGASYQDTCMEAMETCKALVEGPESIRIHPARRYASVNFKTGAQHERIPA